MNEINFDIEKLAVVPIDEVRPNEWNPKQEDTKEFARVKKSLESNGQIVPIYVREKDGYEIVDGQQRWTACTELGFSNLLIYNFGDIDDKTAQEYTIWLQEHVPFDYIDLAHLVTKMRESHGDDLNLPYNKVQLAEFEKTSKFNFDEYDQRRPEITTGVRTLVLKMEADRYDMIMGTIARMKEKEEIAEDSMALEMICAEWNAGA